MVNVPAAAPGTLLRPDHGDFLDALMFLNVEAELADSWDLTGWLALLAPDIAYRMPVRATRARGDDTPAGSWLYHEDATTLELRVRRLRDAESAWSENPRSRVRRFVTNVRVRRGEGRELYVRSNLLLLRSRLDRDEYDFVSAERDDLLTRAGDGELRLGRRDITIDQSRLGMANLPFPL